MDQLLRAHIFAEEFAQIQADLESLQLDQMVRADLQKISLWLNNQILTINGLPEDLRLRARKLERSVDRVISGRA